MATTPPAEVDITAELVRRLLEDQHPDLASQPLRPEASGWDNSVYRLGSALSVRLPRRSLAAGLLLSEQRWLPTIAALVPVAVPAPVRTGIPTSYYPWSWSITPWFPGATVASVPREERSAFAETLGQVIVALGQHAPHDAPVNPYRGVPLAARDASVRERLSSGLIPHADAAERLWNDAIAQPTWSGAPLWVHGDLHPANLIAADGALCSVIDFGDLTSGDPATDLAAAWLVFDPAGRARFRLAVDAGRPTDLTTWRRAAGWALVLSTALLVASDDAPVLRQIGAETLQELLRDS
ncbi:aminoglycoside phosphotransferase (APT) family kinase protein [Mycetocola sp. CAN_C7]|uniref:aminoglycoside phosphotransferase family protein n=1 Tax=Mycetocola sp. CAN_C7 TaxID=2787724 RepID=UPI0018C93937